MLLTNVKQVKYNKKDGAVLLRYWHQFPRWTLMDSWKREVRPDAWDESVSTGCLSKPTMNARDTANVIRNL